jgi:hypothetical protein
MDAGGGGASEASAPRMSRSIPEILAPLEPHWDRIIRTPMSDAEIDDLGRRVGLAVPGALREYLAAVGLFQDLTWGTSDIEMFTKLEEFVSTREFLTGLLPPKYANLFAFGGDGAGNAYCLPAGEDASTRICFVDHETRKVAQRKELGEWLEGVVKKALRGIKRRPPNERKAWCVQFSLPGMAFEELMALLRGVGAVKPIDAAWMNSDTSEAEVTSSDRRFELDGETLQARRLEYEGWDGPQLYFDMREPMAAALEKSRIRTLDALFKAKCPGYKLIDYGALDLQALD